MTPTQTRHSFGRALAEAICVHPELVPAAWPKVKGWVKDAMSRADLGTFNAVESDVLAARALLWLIWRDPDVLGAAVTQIAQTEKSKVCTILACGGRQASQWVNLIERIESYAADEGCDCVRIFSRKGWARLLRDYRAPRVILEKRL